MSQPSTPGRLHVKANRRDVATACLVHDRSLIPALLTITSESGTTTGDNITNSMVVSLSSVRAKPFPNFIEPVGEIPVNGHNQPYDALVAGGRTSGGVHASQMSGLSPGGRTDERLMRNKILRPHQPRHRI